MSKAKNNLALFESLLVRLGGPRVLNGKQLSIDNTQCVISVQYLWLLAWVDIHDSVIDGSLYRLADICRTESVDQLYSQITLAAETLRLKRFDSYGTFKQYLRNQGFSLLPILGSVRTLLDDWFRLEDLESFRKVYGWLLFPTRNNIRNIDEYSDDQLAKWLNREELNRNVCPTDEEARIIASWFPKSDVSYLAARYEPQFNTGAVSNSGKALYQKYRAFSSTPRNRYLECFSSFHVGEAPWDMETYFPPKEQPLVEYSSLLTVPKSWKGYRTVTMEPIQNVWSQFGWAHAISEYLLNRKTRLSRRYCIDTEQWNRDLAWEGSIDGSYSTIDLSSASDSVTWRAVRKWFRDTSIFIPLVATRTKTVKLPDGTLHDLQMYAGMGARLCFLIETTVFAAIVAAAIQSTGDDYESSRFVVYGDDIVVESKYAECVIERLRRNGFEPNVEKSFTNTDGLFFRESCGGEYLFGHDVTPLRTSRTGFVGLPGIARGVKPTHYEGLIDLANECYARYPTVRAAIIHSFKKNNILLPEFSLETGLFSPNCTNFDKQRWYNFELQQYEIEVGSLSVQYPRKDDGVGHLYEWLRRSRGRKRLLYPEDRVDVRMSSPSQCRWEARFLPLTS